MTEQDDDNEVLKTFDMYRFFSRADVIVAILFVLGLLAYLIYRFLLAGSHLV